MLFAVHEEARLMKSTAVLLSASFVLPQVLITLDNIADRSQYLNTRQTFKALFDYGVIPIGR